MTEGVYTIIHQGMMVVLALLVIIGIAVLLRLAISDISKWIHTKRITREDIAYWVEWVIFAGWYKGSDLGDGIVVSLLSGMFFMVMTILLIGYGVYHIITIFV